jgi:heat-inducible transcriptional repressor
MFGFSWIKIGPFIIYMNELTTRQKKILHSLVHRFIDTATPVSSSCLVDNYNLNCSSATVRNELANLETAGYIQQPHTSAGRIPTDKGYRFYVDTLKTSKQVSHEVHEQIYGRIEDAGGNLKLILEEASRILSTISKELGVVLTPWLTWDIFDRLELIELSSCKILVVLHVRSRLVKTVILEVESDLQGRDLDITASILNERLSGLTLQEIKTTIADRMRNVTAGNRVLMRHVIQTASRLFDFSEPLDLHMCGTQNILSQPEFTDVNFLESVIGLIEDKSGVIHLFHRKVQKTEVTIGMEHGDSRLEPFTVITAPYHRGRDVGTLGVIGPTRMHYQRILPLVNTMASMISQFLS